MTGVVGGLERDREAGFPGKQNLWVAGMHDSLRRFPDSGRARSLSSPAVRGRPQRENCPTWPRCGLGRAPARQPEEAASSCVGSAS